MKRFLYILAIMSILAIIGPAASAGTCSKTIYAFPGQHIELEAKTTPTTGLEHKWSPVSPASWTEIQEDGKKATDSNAKIIFDLPAAATGDYVLKDLVKQIAATNCNAEDCVTIHVIDCCKNWGPFCNSDDINFCWYDCLTGGADPGMVHAGSLTFHWYYNQQWPVTGSADDTDACTMPDFTALSWTQPTASAPATNYMTWTVTQTKGHYTNQVLYHCTDDFLVYDSPLIDSIDVV